VEFCRDLRFHLGAHEIEGVGRRPVIGGRAGPHHCGRLDTLAVFGAEAEDRETELEDAPQADDEPSIGGPIDNEREFDDCDLEDDCPGARKRFARERQGPVVRSNGIGGCRYDGTKDWNEQRQVERALAEQSSARR